MKHAHIRLIPRGAIPSYSATPPYDKQEIHAIPDAFRNIQLSRKEARIFPDRPCRRGRSWLPTRIMPG
ncbi:hypothetical protein, partial [Komagataeibacter rhaeticus]|uniref:hypothetical protein n=1 Tax=Komagataeibacter rhaeticus TaxID=215221 RepID=UPI002230BAD6